MNIRTPLGLMAALALVAISAGALVAQPITIVESVICRQIVDRMPVDPGNYIPADTQQVFCFTRLEGAASETTITHNWYYGGSLKASVVLPVRSSPWRTWSSKTLLPEWTGEWMVEVLAEDGTALESLIFHVQ